MDLLDYANFNGDYLTIYVYLTDVNSNQSPLNIINKSHFFIQFALNPIKSSMPELGLLYK